MNYYERHIGDYLKDTAHLSLLEHGVYTRLMDVYYTREDGIPETEAARLIGARSREEKQALEVVLSEFFVPDDEGKYRQARCDQEIQRFRSKSQKARESVNKRWQAVQRANNERNTNVSEDEYERIAKAIHRAPVPSHQISQKQNQEAARSDATIPAAGDPAGVPTPPPAAPTRRGSIAAMLRGLGIACTYSHPTVVEWAQSGVTDEALREAVAVARMRKPEPEQIPIAYLARIVHNAGTEGASNGASAPRHPTSSPAVTTIANLTGKARRRRPDDDNDGAIDGAATRVG